MGNTRSTPRVVRQGDCDMEAIVADPEAAARDLTQVQRTEALVGLARMVRDLRSELEVKDGINNKGCTTASPCEFDRLFTRDVPHILEGIFNLLDYETFMTCRNVCKSWNELLSSEPYQKIAETLLRKRSRDWLDCKVFGCPFWTIKRERLELHMAFHPNQHPNKLLNGLECPDCDLKFPSQEVTDIMYHVVKEHGLGPFRSLKALS